MYLAVDGIGGFPEFLWFYGTSDLDGHGGQWTLNHSYEFQEKGNGNYVEAGKLIGDLDAFYNIHIYNNDQQDFIDVNIEWSTTEYNGRVKCPEFFQTSEWNCWDGYGYDVVCEN